MGNLFQTNRRHHIILLLAFMILSVFLFWLPTGYEKRTGSQSVRCVGRVLEVDDSEIQQLGLIKTGDQKLQINLESGPFKGRVVAGNNPLLGIMQQDKVFSVGDRVFVILTLNKTGDQIVFVNPQDFYRIDLEIVLLIIFASALILFGGWTGTKALMSFILSALVIWKILVPSLLKGYDPLLVSLAVVAFFTALILFLVAGFTRTGVVAVSGAFLGVLTSCLLAIYFTHSFHVHGAVLPFSETLLYSGFGHLNLTRIYIAAVFIAASGAVMDLAMDVAASMQELVYKHGEIPRVELMKSGFRVGRAVVGTMTTTLLFAYSGGYITLLMAFMAQGVPIANLFNIIYVATEVLKTLVGSFGLVMVAPFTALIGGLVLGGKKGKRPVGSLPASQC
ncbi:MAG: YibE/F family protein [Deltaproteobacteria bacterium]|nr:YibE/F family protein [Deltaproteobacteria bacterium]